MLGCDVCDETCRLPGFYGHGGPTSHLMHNVGFGFMDSVFIAITTTYCYVAAAWGDVAVAFDLWGDGALRNCGVLSVVVGSKNCFCLSCSCKLFGGLW